MIITTPKQLKVKIEYIHNNSVKSHLVRKAEDWTYSSAQDWLTGHNGLIEIDKDHKWLVDL